MKKKIGIIIAIVAIIAFLLSYIISYANTGETLHVNLTRLDTTGIGYGIGNAEQSSGNNAVIWNITTHDANGAVSATQRNLYCVKANYGATWETAGGPNTVLDYNLSYDLQKDRTELLNKIVDNRTDIDDVVKTLLSESGYYRELLWILDNSYIPGTTDKKEFLKSIGIEYDSELQAYVYNPISGYDYSSHVSGNSMMFGYSEEHLMTEADIKAVQRAAIWYYTNYKQDPTNNEVFNNKERTDWLTITKDGTTYQQLSDYNKTTGEGPERFEQAQILYNYLIDAASNNKEMYTAANNYTVDGGVKVNTDGLSANAEGKYKLTTTRVGNNYVVGPIKIDKNGTVQYGITIEVTDQNGNKLNYTYTDQNGNSLGTTDIKTLVGKDGGFYITVARANVEKVNVKIEVTQTTTKKTLWLKGTESTDKIVLEKEQPIVEVTRKEEKIPTEFESQPEEFDLALRKYITQVNGTNVANTRVPNIDLSTLQSGTTATYKHRKDPVVVNDKDEVTYTLAIYNEGNKAGYASEIVDQLPTGLVMASSTTSTVVSKDKNGNAKNTYTIKYEPSANKITLTIDTNSAKSLSAYKTGTLDWETIEIKCKVAQTPDTQNQIILTNVAWISGAYDSESKTLITTKGQDRDSEPQTKPNVNKNNMQNYKGNETNKDDLADQNYFYQGEQDDDDFEKLVIMPEEKIFDLALFKHIAAISKNQTIEDGEYVTDTGKKDGTYLRAPVVTNIDKETGKITYKQNDKEALIVEQGDYVLYTIRVYNEGEVNGYASKIKDTLPIGLEFVTENEEYNGIWNLEGLDSDGRQVVTTTWFAKGQGAELNAKEGDANYKANLLKALNKEGEISDENPDYLDAQVLCRVTERATSGRVLVNYAQISDDSDENGKKIDDIDSTPDNFVNPDRDFEDDEDFERIKLRTVGQYDLVLIKEDKDGKQLNSTAKFEVTTNGKTEEKTVTGKLTIAQNMPVDKDHLTDDIYVIKETQAPDSYCEFDGTITITVSKKIKEDGSGYEKSMKYTVVDSKGNDITNNKDANVYVNSDGNIYVEVKNYKEPDIHKGVKDVTNQDSGYNADEKHLWVIESTLPNNIDEYKFYNIIDDIDYRLKFEGSDSVSVKIGNTTLREGTDYRISYTENPTGVQDKTKSGTLILTFIDLDNSIQASDRIKNNAGNKIKVTFNTTFAKDENGKLLAAMGEQINNQAKLEYTNTATDNKVVKETERPEVHTGGVILYKYYLANGQKVSLEGAKFGIYKTEEDAKNNKNVIMTAISDEKGLVKFIGLQYGEDARDIESNKQSDETYKYDADKASTKYWVAEIEAPEGYYKYTDPIEVTISKDSYNEEKVSYEVENTKLNFDLALRKFITKVQDKDITTRIPQPKIDGGKITYDHTKDPVVVHAGDTVIYTIRVYNEGNIDGYAKEIEDNIPEYLEYLPEESTNVEYMWKMYDENGEETTDKSKAVSIRTSYLSKENVEDKLLKAFDGTTLNYKDVKVAFKVKDPNSNTTIITNKAQIFDDSDKNGDKIEDIDSKPGEWNDGEDDQDEEHVKVEYFDLALLKFVSKVIVIEDGKETISETGYNGHEDPEPVVKVDLHKKKLSDVTVKFGYGITIINEGDIPGYAKEITDYIPEGLKFEAADNPLWTDEGNNVISTKQLENTLLQPGETATVEVILTWINDPNNMGLKTNTAEISQDKNEYDVPDRDSTPDNRKEGEDDIDIAKVILSITTGTAKTYFMLITVLLVVVGVGIILIKKYVM